MTFDENCKRLKREAEEKRILREFQEEMQARKQLAMLGGCVYGFGLMVVLLYVCAVIWGR